MKLKRLFALSVLMALGIVGMHLSTTVWPPAILVFHPIAGIIALLLYDGKNFLKGSWTLANTGILAVVMVCGYASLLLYFFCAQDRSIPNRT
jgi:hypothetical protein